ncbi:MAG TPA: carbohydrate kinase family protein [Chthonomonadales bacterium]|nr:carbohydrate kinase family protein [Chthonomonadales bacterium]
MSDQPRSPGKVICAGILVADIFVPPLPELPAAGALLATEDFMLETGGCAANVGVGLARLGADASVCGLVGNDVFADFLRNSLEARGLDVTMVRQIEDLGTSKTVVLTVRGEDRRFLHTFGANAAFSASDMPVERLHGAHLLYLGGYLVLPGLEPDATAASMAAARARGMRTVLDVVVPKGSGVSLDALAPVLPHIDAFLPNDEEAEALTGLREPRAQAARFLELGCGSVVITQGSRGTLMAEGDSVWEAGVYPIDFVDGSGSGDAFAAGYILGMLCGWKPEQRLRFASAVGASACTRLGCTTGVFTREEADRFVASRALDVRVSTL